MPPSLPTLVIPVRRESPNLQIFSSEISIEEFRKNADYKNSHPKWRQEIEDSMNPHLLLKLGKISQEFGMLSSLIFIRMYQVEKKVPVDPK
jgi:hypothetical protein